MEYKRIQSIEDPLFVKMHQLMRDIFPAEEVLAFELWKEPVMDPGIRIFAAVHEGEVLGATEYRYYEDFNVAMTDFTIIGQDGLGIGRFLAQKRMEELLSLAAANGKQLHGMFAEIYEPRHVENHAFGRMKSMNPFVRREVLSHLGYRRLDIPYVHPSWGNDGVAVTGLDLCYLTMDEKLDQIPAFMVEKFLKRYYAVLQHKPKSWYEMIENLENKHTLSLLPI